MREFYVYMYLRSNDSKNGKSGSPYYVGKGRGFRAFVNNRHTPRPKDLANIIVVSKDMYEWDAFQLEILLIARYGRVDIGTGCLRNFTDGGEGTCGRQNRQYYTESSRIKQSASWTEEKRRSMGAKHRGRKLTPEHIEAARSANLGRKQSQETIEKRAAKLRESWASGERHKKLQVLMKKRRLAKGPKIDGRTLRGSASPETKLKMSLAQKARWLIRSQRVQSET